MASADAVADDDIVVVVVGMRGGRFEEIIDVRRRGGGISVAGFFQFLLQPTFPLLLAQESVQVAGLEQKKDGRCSEFGVNRIVLRIPFQ